MNEIYLNENIIMKKKNSTVRKLLPPQIITNSGNFVDTVIVIQNSNDYFKAEITCPICLGPLDKTWTVMACLHRFCFDCFHHSLRMELGSNSQKECPLCRTKLASRRSSRPNEDFDLIVDLLKTTKQSLPSNDHIALSPNYRFDGNFKKFKSSANSSSGCNSSADRSVMNQLITDSKTRSSTASISGKLEIDISACRRAHDEKVSQFRKRQLDYRSSELFVNNSTYYNPKSDNFNTSASNTSVKRRIPTGSNSTYSTNGNCTPNSEFIPVVAFSLIPSFHSLNLVSSLKKPHLKTPPEMTVGSLKQYLERRAECLEQGLRAAFIAVSMVSRHKMIELDDDMSMFKVATELWDKDGKLELFFGKSLRT